MEKYSHITLLKIIHVNPEDIQKCNDIVFPSSMIGINENTFGKIESNTCTLVTSDQLYHIIPLFPNLEEISYNTHYGIKDEDRDIFIGHSYNSTDNPFANVTLTTLRKLKLNDACFEQIVELNQTFPNLEYLYLSWTWMEKEDWEKLPSTLKILTISECWENPEKYIKWANLKKLSDLTVDFTPEDIEDFKKSIPVNVHIKMENDYGIMDYLKNDTHWEKVNNIMIKIKDYNHSKI